PHRGERRRAQGGGRFPPPLPRCCAGGQEQRGGGRDLLPVGDAPRLHEGGQHGDRGRAVLALGQLVAAAPREGQRLLVAVDRQRVAREIEVDLRRPRQVQGEARRRARV